MYQIQQDKKFENEESKKNEWKYIFKRQSLTQYDFSKKKIKKKFNMHPAHQVKPPKKNGRYNV